MRGIERKRRWLSKAVVGVVNGKADRMTVSERVGKVLVWV